MSIVKLKARVYTDTKATYGMRSGANLANIAAYHSYMVGNPDKVADPVARVKQGLKEDWFDGAPGVRPGSLAYQGVEVHFSELVNLP